MTPKRIEITPLESLVVAGKQTRLAHHVWRGFATIRAEVGPFKRVCAA